MALSVLTLPPKRREETGLQCGLFDGEDCIAMGTSEQMYGIKHLAEEYQQSKANEEWKEEYARKMTRMLVSANYSPEMAAQIIERTLQEFKYPHGSTLP